MKQILTKALINLPTGLTQFTEIFITNPTTLRYGDNVSRIVPKLTNKTK